MLKTGPNSHVTTTPARTMGPPTPTQTELSIRAIRRTVTEIEQNIIHLLNIHLTAPGTKAQTSRLLFDIKLVVVVVVV